MTLLPEYREPFRLPVGRTPETDFFSFEGSVGPNGENRREDIIKAQTLLAKTGDFKSPFEIPTGWPSSDLFKGIKAFQTRHGKQPDGTLLPVPPGGVDENGVGESLHALRSELGTQLAGEKAPTPQEVDAHYENEARFRNTVAGEPTSAVMQPQAAVMSDVPDAGLPQAKPGQETALLPAAALLPVAGVAVRTVPQIPNLLRGIIGAASTAAALPLKGDEAMPGETAAPADHDQARAPDPAQPEEDKVTRDDPPQRGRIVIAPDGKELHVPPLGAWANGLSDEKRQQAEEFNEAFTIHMRHHDGGRGSAFTQQGIQALIEACMKEFNQHPELAGKMRHVGGGHDRDSGKRVPEEHLWNYDENGNPIRTGSRRPDLVFEYVGKIIDRLRGNTVDTEGNGGRLSDKEEGARKGIDELANDELLFTFEKWPAGTSVAAMEKAAERVCKAVAIDYAAHIRRKESALPHDHVPPTKYEGPSSAREARPKRELLKTKLIK